MTARGDFMSSPVENCKAAQANLMQILSWRKLNTEEVLAFFVNTCIRHNGTLLDEMPCDVTHQQHAKMMHAAWFRDTSLDDVPAKEESMLVILVCKENGEFELISFVNPDWPQRLDGTLKQLVDGMVSVREKWAALAQAPPLAPEAPALCKCD